MFQDKIRSTEEVITSNNYYEILDKKASQQKHVIVLQTAQVGIIKNLPTQYTKST